MGVTADGANYHGASNTHGNDNHSLDESLAQLQVASNALMQGFQSNISAVSEETQELRAALVATQQQLTNRMAVDGAAGTLWPTIQPMSPTRWPTTVMSPTPPVQ